jgi:hypothetical protein
MSACRHGSAHRQYNLDVASGGTRRSRWQRWPLLLVVSLILTGCVARSGVAVGPSERPGIPLAYVTRCHGEMISSVRLVQLGPDENAASKSEVVLWQIDAQPGQPLDQVAVAEDPPGFVVVVPVHLPLPLDANLDLVVESAVAGDAFFRLSELRPGRVDLGGAAGIVQVVPARRILRRQVCQRADPCLVVARRSRCRSDGDFNLGALGAPQPSATPRSSTGMAYRPVVEAQPPLVGWPRVVWPCVSRDQLN